MNSSPFRPLLTWWPPAKLGRSGPVLEPQWIVTGGAGEIIVTQMPTPPALIATGGTGTITIEG